LVELVYWQLAPQKLQNGADISVFWDKMCLNDGQDWEWGFLHGITSSAVIVLLLSNKVTRLKNIIPKLIPIFYKLIEGMGTKIISNQQDNVLVDYRLVFGY
jgi:hypothetical protein